MSQHTTEPMATHVSGRTVHVNTVQTDGNVATFWAHDVGNKTCLANAHLFKAAPALLAALEHMVREFDGAAGQAMINARAAIAEAKGQAPEVPGFEGTRQALDDLNIRPKGEA